MSNALGLRLGDHAYQSTVVPLVVANVTIDRGKDGPVAAHTDTVTGVETGSELANDDVAGLDELSVAALHSPILGV